MGNIASPCLSCFFMLTLRQVHVLYMDIFVAGVSIALTVAINMRVSFKARIADDDHINRTSFRPVRRAAGFTRRLALPPIPPFPEETILRYAEEKRAPLSLWNKASRVWTKSNGVGQSTLLVYWW